MRSPAGTRAGLLGRLAGAVVSAVAAVALAVCVAPVAAHADEAAPTDAAPTLAEQLAAGGTVTLSEDAKLDAPVTIGLDTVLDLNGHTITWALKDGAATMLTVEGGADLTVKNGTLKANNDWHQAVYGRAIKAEDGSTLTMSGVTVRNFGSTAEAAAVLADNAIVTLTDCVFSENSVKGDRTDYRGGGAVHVSGGSAVLTAEGCTFSDNYAEKTDGGGALYVDNKAKAAINNCVFTGNDTNTGPGGAIYFRINGASSVTNSTVDSNFARGDGGGIRVAISDADSSIVLSGNTISNNEAASNGRGGGLSLNVGAQSGGVALGSGKIVNNKASWGGGIDYTGHGMKPLELQNVLITENTAVRGAGVWACPTSETTISSTLGGAIYGNTATGEIPENYFGGYAALAASGDDVRYEGADTDDTMTLEDPYEENDYSNITVMPRALGGGLMSWYNDAAGDRYQAGDPLADEALYTGARDSFGLHGELSESNQQLAANEATLIISGNTAERRGGGIASNSEITIGQKDADKTVKVVKTWEAGHDDVIPDSVLVDLYRIDAEGNEVKLDTDVELTAEGGWEYTFVGLPASYLDANGDVQPYTYTVREQAMSAWTADEPQVVTDGRATTVTINNRYTPDPVTLEVTATKHLTGAELADGQFKFELRQNGSLLATGTNAADGTVTFSELEFTQVGTYVFTVSEVKGDDANMTYDDSELSLTVVVAANDDGTLRVAVDEDASDELVFNNTYTEPTPITPVEPDVPKTGDTTNAALPVALLVAGAAALSGTLMARRLKDGR